MSERNEKATAPAPRGGLESLEERIEKPGYLLFLVVNLLLLIIGFVNVLSHEGDGTTVLGVFSLRQTAALLVYAAVIIGWAALFLRPNNDDWLTGLVAWIQRRPAAGLVMLAGYAAVFWHMLTWERWLAFPVLQTAMMVGMLIFAGLVLFQNWSAATPPQAWRRVVAYGLGGLLVAELLVQLLAQFGALPTLGDARTPVAPYNRIYVQAPHGTTDAIANEYGFYYPDFLLAEDSRRIVLAGDRFLQGWDVPMEDHVGLALQGLLDETGGDRPVEVLPLGYPDYGPGVYLDVPLFLFPEAEFEPDEVIIFFDLANDFQTLAASDGQDFYFFRDGDDVALSEPDFLIRHDDLHEALWSLEGYQPRRFLGSHVLSVRLARQLLAAEPALASELVAAPQGDVTLPNSFVFYEDRNDEALFVANTLVRRFNDHAVEQGITVRVVTIPVFPDEFYAQGNDAQWTTRFGDADLFLPEREMAAYAAEQGVSFLAMGEYMRAQGLTVEEIRALYHDDGRGTWTPAGHAFFAEAAFSCFYDGALSDGDGCRTAD